ncbi:MAG: EamA family transporter [Candidatus Eremiobacteraeota bacterium]|nr:EamA family transporter [Candidatus Eremiobacteraeota bacterium]
MYVLWGSTSPAIKVAVASLPPFAMVALRFATAGTILWLWSRLRRVALPSAAEWRGAALTGTVLLVASNGVFSWTLRYVPAGIGALFFAIAPLWMAVFGFFLYRERLAPLAALGLGIGLCGMIFLYSPSGAQHLPLLPTVVGFVCSLAWAFGSMIQRKLAASDVVQMSAMQMLVAALVLALLAAATGEHLTLAQFTPSASAALAYLIVFGSIVGFSAFLWLMNHVQTTLASTYSYVNPVVSIALGVGVLHERFSWQLAAGAAVIVGGVAVMMLAPRPSRAAAPLGSAELR